MPSAPASGVTSALLIRPHPGPSEGAARPSLDTGGAGRDIYFQQLVECNSTVSGISLAEFIAIALLIGLSLAGSVVAQLVFRQLEVHHRAEWERLGRPNLVRASSGSALELMRFAWSRRYTKLGDRRLNILMVISMLLTAGIIGQMLFIGLWL